MGGGSRTYTIGKKRGVEEYWRLKVKGVMGIREWGRRGGVG